ncbi:MAG TPA: hypothetical protein VEF05_02895 [Terriglobales bacterium]|nr:hypothetical protein [Terriglobales bacterium]
MNKLTSHMPQELRTISRAPQQSSPTVRDLAAVLFRQKRVALTTSLLVFSAVLIYGLVFPPYESEMKILLRHSRVDPVVAAIPSQPEFERQAVSEEEVNSETELLQDEEILRTVIQKTGLISEGRSWFWGLAGDNPDRQLARAVRRISKRLTIESAHKASLITATYNSSDREQGAKLLRALGKAYVERHHQVHNPSGSFDFFDQQVRQSRAGLEAAELHLMEFTRDQGVVAATQERDFVLQRLSEAETDAGQTKVARAQNSERIRVLQVKLNLLPERTLSLIRNLDNPQLLESLKSRLLELQLKRTELLTQYEPSYRLVQEVDEEIAAAKATIAAEEQSPMRDQTSELEPNHEWAKSELLKAQVEASALEAHEKAETSLLANYRERAHELGNRAIEQEQLVNDLKAAEEKYLLYVNKREESRIGDALNQGGILNVAIAEQPTVPALPKLSAVAFGLIGLALAGTLAVGMAFAADYLSPTFRTPDEISAYLGAPVLASLPPRTLVEAEFLGQSRLP